MVRRSYHPGRPLATTSTIDADFVKDTTVVLALFGAFLTFSGAFSNWWTARFTSNYRESYQMLSAAFAVATVVLVAVALWAKFSKPGATRGR